MKKILVDSGPLIALFNGNDKYHNKAIEFIKINKSFFYTTLAIITETVYMLDFNINAQSDFLLWISKGGIKIIDIDSSDLARCSTLMIKYSDLPMDFADATIILACEKLGTKNVGTIDSDFNLYRYNNKYIFKNYFPM